MTVSIGVGCMDRGDMRQDRDSEFMARALRLAERGRFTTSPNPRVGCVLVREGQVLAEGWHHRAGEPHAECVAIARATQPLQGATAYVSLEPCSQPRY